MPRFEEQVGISLICRCSRIGTMIQSRMAIMMLKGNLSLREAGASRTRLAYECPRCHRRVSVWDDWGEAAPPWVHELEE